MASDSKVLKICGDISILDDNWFNDSVSESVKREQKPLNLIKLPRKKGLKVR